MPFRLTNTLAAFQRFVNDIFSDMLDVNIIVYLDNILIYSDNPKEHTEHVQEVLWHLRQHRLYAKSKKSEFSKMMVEYLGFILSPSGLTMDKSNMYSLSLALLIPIDDLFPTSWSL